MEVSLQAIRQKDPGRGADELGATQTGTAN